MRPITAILLATIALLPMLGMRVDSAAVGGENANATPPPEQSQPEQDQPAPPASDPDAPWYDKKSTWRGFSQYHFKVQGRSAFLVTPLRPAVGKPWIWRARFPGYHTEADDILLARGYHLAYLDVANLFGNPQAVEYGDAFYTQLTQQHGLAPKPALEGVSRGGLFVYNWAAKNPDKVACIYCDTPVLDFKSWPGGKGEGNGSPKTWAKLLEVYELTEEQALAYDKNPLNHAKVIAEAKIPIMHIVSENDRIVPTKENTYILRDKLNELGHEMQIISVRKGTEKSDGHHFTHPDPKRVAEFIHRHARAP